MMDFAPNQEEKKYDIPWNVLIVDDEDTVHSFTKLALKNFVYDNKKLNFLSSFSAQEALKTIIDNKNIDMILLDVIMETDTAGLDLVTTIREEVKNKYVPIVIRTGQAGKEHESYVVNNYDINDYKEKGTLTAQKLNTATKMALYHTKQIKELLTKVS